MWRDIGSVEQQPSLPDPSNSNWRWQQCKLIECNSSCFMTKWCNWIKSEFVHVNLHIHVQAIVYTEFISIWLWRKLLAYRNTPDFVPGTNQYRAIGVKFLAQGNNGLSLTGFETMWLVILRLLVWHINHSTTPPH